MKQTLDKAEALDLAVVVDIPLPTFKHSPEYYEDQKLFEVIKEKVADFVGSHKDHKALLYWNLGNEIRYPYGHNRTPFFSNYNSLIDLIHETDPNHPVSTTTIGANRMRVLSIISRSPQLDFVSFNSFGSLSSFSKNLDPISFFWTGPYVISEWGVNGPWEAQTTSWNAPIEQTSTKKAEHIKERYNNFIKPFDAENSLGSFIFYWGKKNETTPTWFSLFGEGKVKSQGVFELKNIWNETESSFKGPTLDYMLLNGRGALESIILSPNEEAEATVVRPESLGPLNFNWEIRKESWHEDDRSDVLINSNFKKSRKIKFRAPKEEGPYRLFVYLTDESEYFATANIPFYVLNPDDEE